MGKPFPPRNISHINMAAFWNKPDELRLEVANLARIETALGAQTPLMIAAAQGHGECVKILLPLCDPLQHSFDHNNALMQAVARGFSECVRLLASHSDLNALDRNDMDALMRAMMAIGGGKNIDLAPLLTPHSAIRRDKHQWSALHHAATEGAASAIPFLLAHGFDANAQNDEGETALMSAARWLNVECVRLLAAVSDVSLKNEGGRTALEAMLVWNTENSGAAAQCADILALDANIHEARRVMERFGAENMPQAKAMFDAAALREELSGQQTKKTRAAQPAKPHTLRQWAMQPVKSAPRRKKQARADANQEPGGEPGTVAKSEGGRISRRL